MQAIMISAAHHAHYQLLATPGNAVTD